MGHWPKEVLFRRTVTQIRGISKHLFIAKLLTFLLPKRVKQLLEYLALPGWTTVTAQASALEAGGPWGCGH